jgi:uncharacterized membrane protein YgcG
MKDVFFALVLVMIVVFIGLLLGSQVRRRDAGRRSHSSGWSSDSSSYDAGSSSDSGWGGSDSGSSSSSD